MNCFRLLSRQFQQGFTLVEIILSLVVIGIVAAMLATYVGNSMSRSFTPGDNLRDTLQIASVMEQMRLEYDNNANMSISTLKSDIGTAASNPQSNSFGAYNVVYNDYVQCDATATATFTSDSSCDPAADSCVLLVTISDPDQPGIHVSNIFTE
jgi:prepilin-type N-terminal cleavage/methylation domain-containing protein